MNILSLSWENFQKKLNLSEEGLNFLYCARELAKRYNYFLYIAGGPVRDYILGREIIDLDLCLEGDWEKLLPELLNTTKASLLFKSFFFTYKIQLKEGFTIDLVTARKEVYPEPAKLPRVEAATFKDDILRRDFTINALIYGLSAPFEEKIIDLTTGLKDLSEGLIKPLYEHTFVEDPTRVLRGIRYKVRFNFRYAKNFYTALKKAIDEKALLKLSSTRLTKELKLFLIKEPWEKQRLLLKELQELNILNLFGLKERSGYLEDFFILEKAKSELSLKSLEKFYLLFLIDIDPQNLERLSFSEEETNKLIYYLNFLKEKKILKREDLLENLEVIEKIPDYILFRLALEEGFMPLFLEYWEKYRKIKPVLTGRDLQKLGIKDGKRIGEILKTLRRKKILEEIKTPEEEIKWAQGLIFKGE